MAAKIIEKRKSVAKQKTPRGSFSYFALALALFFSMIAAPTYAVITTQGKGCQGNLLCDTTTTCDTSTNQCTTTHSNCQSCGIEVVRCTSGDIEAAKICQDSVQAQCISDPNACTTSTEPGVARKILQFAVFVKKTFQVTIEPSPQATTAGNKLTYKATVKNSNPISIEAFFDTDSAVPSGWNMTDVPKSLIIPSNSEKFFSFGVIPPAGAPTGSYTVHIKGVAPKLLIFFDGTAVFKVAERAAPTVAIAPKAQTGKPGETLRYDVAITNNDPEGFDPSTFLLRAVVPAGWNAVFSRSSLRVDVGKTETVNLSITSSKNISDVQTYAIAVNASANQMSGVDFASYTITFCGDGLCQMNEACAADCGTERDFSCSGRCESEADDGVLFNPTVRFATTKFIACKYGSTAQQCESDYDNNRTGMGRNALCGARSAPCTLRCVDGRGEYYLYAESSSASARSLFNYTFACPVVNLPEIQELKRNFTAAFDGYEKEQSALIELLRRNATEREKKQACLDTLGVVVRDVGAHVKFLEGVVNSPAKSNTTLARSRSAELRNSIDTRLSQFCHGAGSGFLRIDALTISSTEINTNATASMAITNAAGLRYYSYSSCDFTFGARKISANDSCGAIEPGQTRTFTPQARVEAAGAWTVQCKSYGSLSSNCEGATAHDTETKTFDVFTKEIFVSDVSASCDSIGVRCIVRASQPSACVSCMLSNRTASTQCEFASRNGTTSIFNCPRILGASNVTASVHASNECIPVAPANKTATVLCPGCGDGLVQPSRNETCELPNTDNNTNVHQTSGLQCSGRRSATRDAFGYCSASCQSVQDALNYVCDKDLCAAQCSNGETRDRRISNSTGTCYVTEQCLSSCIFSAASCEPSGNATIRLALNMSVTPDQPTTLDNVTIMAESSQSGAIQIFVDNTPRATCSAQQCSYTSNYSAGTHRYFAAVNYTNITLRNPLTGTNSFSVVQAAANASTANTTTNTTTIINTTTNTTMILSASLTVSHAPSNPTTNDIVSVAAQANVSFNNIQIFVDNSLRMACASLPCVNTSRYSAGTHSYHAVMNYSGGILRSPASGFNSFAAVQPVIRLNLTLSIEPAEPSTNDTVRISALSDSIFDTIEIFVDSALRITCSDSPCQYNNTYAAGGHRYYTLINYSGVGLRSPASGTHLFTIGTSPGRGSTPGNTSTNVTSPIPRPAQTNTTIPAPPAPSYSATNGSNTLTLSVEPASPTTRDIVTIVSESNLSGNIEIFVDGFSARRCVGTLCVLKNAYAAGAHSVYAQITNSLGNVRAPSSGTVNFTVSAAGAAANGTTGAGGAAAGTAGAPGSCSTKILAKSCFYNENTKSYFVNATANWTTGAGDHAHLIIDNDENRKFYTNQFTRVAEMASPGTKVIIAAVHDRENSELCIDKATVVCGAPTQGNISVFRNISSVVRLGMADMEIVAVSDKSGLLNFTEYVPAELQISGMTSAPLIQPAQGNATDAGKNYKSYSFMLNMSTSSPFTVRYKVNFAAEGDYRFFYKALMNETEKTESKIVFATACAQASSVYAKNGTECRIFRTVCAVPAGWNIVDTCETQQQQQNRAEPELDLIIIILVVVLAIIAGLAIRYKDKLADKFGGGREKKILRKMREAG